MSATYSAEHETSRALHRLLDFDPDSAAEVFATLNPAAAAKGIALSLGYRRYLFGVMRSVGVGGITTVRIVAAEDAALTVNPTTVVTRAAVTADAVGDTVFVECDIEQIREVLASAAYVGLGITLATNTDECVVMLRAADPLFAHAGLTADYIS